MARITKPGGHILLTADNRTRLTNILDPWLNPWLATLKQVIKTGLVWMRLRRPTTVLFSSTYHSLNEVNRMLDDAHLVKEKSKTLGFGPFTFHRRRIFSEPLASSLHRWFQGRADHNNFMLRGAGAQYIVLVRK